MDNVTPQNESKIKKVLYNEISLAIAVVSLVSGVIIWMTNPGIILSQRVSTLESEVTHQSEIYISEEKYQSETLTEIKDRLKSIEDRQLEIIQSVARLESK